jgi:hypothetical protein
MACLLYYVVMNEKLVTGHNLYSEPQAYYVAERIKNVVDYIVGCRSLVWEVAFPKLVELDSKQEWSEEERQKHWQSWNIFEGKRDDALAAEQLLEKMMNHYSEEYTNSQAAEQP